MDLGRKEHLERMARVVLIGLLAWGFGMRLHGVLVLKKGLSHDESVSYLCAAATEGAYQENIDGMVDRRWVAGDIQAYYTRPSHMMLGTVSHDLAHYDIHPPLYFWALHAVHVLFGAGISGGALLNVFAGVGVGALMLMVARRLWGNSPAVWVALALWYLSPAVVQIDLEARHYQFMALFAMASYLLSDRLLNGTVRPWHRVLFTLVNAAGMLTHYYFTFLLLPGALFMLFRNGFRAPTLRYALSLLASVALFLALFPEIFDFIDVYKNKVKDPADAVSFLDRVRTFFYAALAFFANGHLLRYVYLLVCTAFGTAGLWILFRRGSFQRIPWDRPIMFYTMTMLWAGAFTLALYLMGVSPPHAVGEQYLAYFWPLLAVVIVDLAMRVIPRRGQGWILMAHMAQLCIAFPASIAGSEYVQNVLPEAWYARMAGSDLLITDDRKRSGLPRIMHHLPADLPFVILSKVEPKVDDATTITFLHLDVKGRPSVDPFLTRMKEQGFTEQTASETQDHYELYTFRR